MYTHPLCQCFLQLFHITTLLSPFTHLLFFLFFKYIFAFGTLQLHTTPLFSISISNALSDPTQIWPLSGFQKIFAHPHNRCVKIFNIQFWSLTPWTSSFKGWSNQIVHRNAESDMKPKISTVTRYNLKMELQLKEEVKYEAENKNIVHLSDMEIVNSSSIQR